MSRNEIRIVHFYGLKYFFKKFAAFGVIALLTIIGIGVCLVVWWGIALLLNCVLPEILGGIIAIIGCIATLVAAIIAAIYTADHCEDRRHDEGGQSFLH